MHKTRVGKLTYLAYFLIKLYHSYYRLRSYAYKYSLRSRDIVKRQTGSYVAKKKKHTHGRSFLAKQARKRSMRGSVVLNGINIRAHVRRIYKRRRSTYKKRARTGKNIYFDNSILQKKPKHVSLKYKTLYLKRKSKARLHEKNSTRAT